MPPRRRHLCLPLALLALAVSASPASAAPRVTSVEGVTYSHGGPTEYVVFDVQTKGASLVRLSWGKKRQARQRVRNGRIGLGFDRRNARSFKVAVRACKRRRCSRVKRFSGRFRVIRADTEPPPNSPPVTPQTGGGLPIPLPGLPPVPGLPELPGLPKR